MHPFYKISLVNFSEIKARVLRWVGVIKDVQRTHTRARTHTHTQNCIQVIQEYHKNC